MTVSQGTESVLVTVPATRTGPVAGMEDGVKVSMVTVRGVVAARGRRCRGATAARLAAGVAART
ncbi:hypothetical protein GCM10027448_03710 [Nocardioides dilutus]